jgi:hypothetical protein
MMRNRGCVNKWIQNCREHNHFISGINNFSFYKYSQPRTNHSSPNQTDRPPLPQHCKSMEIKLSNKGLYFVFLITIAMATRGEGLRFGKIQNSPGGRYALCQRPIDRLPQCFPQHHQFSLSRSSRWEPRPCCFHRSVLLMSLLIYYNLLYE